jgi:peptide/nickel transport system permease protein
MTQGGLGAAAAPVGAAPRVRSSTFLWARFRRDRLAVASGVVLVLLVLASFAGPPIAAHFLGHGPDDPLPGAVDANLKPVGPWTHVSSSTTVAGSTSGDETLLILGADGPLGRDLFERVLVGGRISLEVAFGATFLAMLIGILLGGAAGYYGGTTDAVVGRLIDFVMAFPLLLLLLLLGNTVGDELRGITLHGALQPGVFSLVLLIGIFAWFYPARIVRGEVSALKESEFVASARMVGAGEWRILRAHILPHVMPLMLAYSAFLVATTILMEAGLSFLNVGVRLPTASWGSLLTAAWGTQRNPEAIGPERTIWMTLVPTLVIFVAAAAWMLFGEGLRRALDPRGE